MGNQIELKRTKFTNLGDGYETNNMLIENEIPKDDLELIKLAKDEYPTDVVSAMFDHIEEMEDDICVDGEYYEWKDIKHLFE
jgi:hypothetical protein